MKNNIKEKMKERKRGKTNINITIDKDLKNRLIEYKKNNKISQLSPMINEMLWDWMQKEELKESGKNHMAGSRLVKRNKNQELSQDIIKVEEGS